MSHWPKLRVKMDGVEIGVNEATSIAEAMAKRMQGSLLQVRGGTNKWGICEWEFWIELNPNLYRETP